jgi:polysaccharide biosynthesis transport protein
MTDPQQPGTSPDAESTHRALIEHPIPSALSTHVLPTGLSGMDGDDDTINLREYWEVVYKRKKTVIIFLLIALISTYIATSLTTPIFRATTVLQIEEDTAKVVEYQDVAQPGAMGFSTKDFYQTQYELMKSTALAVKVVEQLGLARLQSAEKTSRSSLRDWFASKRGNAKEKAETPRTSPKRENIESAKMSQAQALLGGLTVQPVGDSRLVNISFDSPDPVLAASVANAVAESFIATNLARRFEATSYAKTFLEERIAQEKARLEEAERSLLGYARDQEIFNVGKEGETTASQNLQEFNAAFAQAQQARIKAESLYNQLQSSQSGDLPQVLENKLILSLQESKLKLEADYQEKLKTFKPGYPAMQELAAQLAEVKAQLEAEKINVRGMIKASYEEAKAHEALLAEKLSSSKQEAMGMQTRGIQYGILKREADTNRQMYEGLLQRLKEVSVAGGVGTNNVFVVDKAQVPGGPYTPDMRRNLMIALLFGLMGGIALAFFFEHLDDTFKRAVEVEKQLNLAVLGIIPESMELREGLGALHAAIESPRSVIVESYRSVRTALQFSREGGAPKLLAVTSSEMGEGKTTSAVSIAIQFAQLGSRVLLIDADLRNPSLHKLFDVDLDPGLSNYLAGAKQPVEITHNTPIANLYFMASGSLPPNPAELLSGNKMVKLLELAATKFDHVIIDSPPILGLADALVISNLVDAMLLVVEAGETKRAAVEAALKRLISVRARPIGCLLTKMKQNSFSYGYGYEYYYTYGGKSRDNQKKLST